MSIARILAAAAAVLLVALPAAADMTTCRLTYAIKGWSFVYKQYKGSGTVTCGNGQTANVRIVTRGGGFTLGKSEIDDGKGAFSEVRDISEIFGSYVSASSSAGATKSVEAAAMTKGEISLALTGTGRGFDLGVSFGVFTIERAEPAFSSGE
jgi:hypothetical protein